MANKTLDNKYEITENLKMSFFIKMVYWGKGTHLSLLQTKQSDEVQQVMQHNLQKIP